MVDLQSDVLFKVLGLLGDLDQLAACRLVCKRCSMRICSCSSLVVRHERLSLTIIRPSKICFGCARQAQMQRTAARCRSLLLPPALPTG